MFDGLSVRQRIKDQGGLQPSSHCRHCQGFRVLSLGVNLVQQLMQRDQVTRSGSFDELLFC